LAFSTKLARSPPSFLLTTTLSDSAAATPTTHHHHAVTAQNHPQQKLEACISCFSHSIPRIPISSGIVYALFTSHATMDGIAGGLTVEAKANMLSNLKLESK
jgi:hypothetical protein